MPRTTSALDLDRAAGAVTAGPPPPARAHAASLPRLGLAAAAWGLAPHLALILVAVIQLSRAGIRGLAASDPGAVTWLLTAATVAAFCWGQGYRCFQRRWSRMVVARALHLARHPRPWHALAAPLHVCGLVHASRRRQVAAAALFVAIPLLSAGVRRLPEPARAIVDLGVAAGLAWGLASIVAFLAGAAAGRPPDGPLDLPGEAAP